MYSTEKGSSVKVAIRLSGPGLAPTVLVSKAGGSVFAASLNPAFDMGDGFYSVVLEGTEVDQIGPVTVAFQVGGVTQEWDFVQVVNTMESLIRQIRGFQTSSILQPLVENATADRAYLAGLIRDLLGTQVMDLKRGSMSDKRK